MLNEIEKRIHDILKENFNIKRGTSELYYGRARHLFQHKDFFTNLIYEFRIPARLTDAGQREFQLARECRRLQIDVLTDINKLLGFRSTRFDYGKLIIRHLKFNKCDEALFNYKGEVYKFFIQIIPTKGLRKFRRNRGAMMRGELKFPSASNLLNE